MFFQKKAKKDDWNLDDFLEQMQQVKEMGSVSNVLQGIPGLSELIPHDAEDDLRQTETIMLAMTPEERGHPEIIDKTRQRRIAADSESTVQEVKKLLKDFKAMKRMMRRMA